METKKFLDGEGLKTLWSEITSLQSDYNETDETSPNYIKNKPFTIDAIPEEIIEEFTFTTSDTIDSSTGLPTMQYVQLFNDLTIGQKMNLQFTYPELAAATGLPQYDDNGEVIFKTVRYEDVEVGNFADAMGSEFLDSPAIMMGPGAMIATLPESIQRVAIPNNDIVFVYSNATLADGTKVPLLITALIDQTTGGYSTYVNNCIINTFIPENAQLNAESIIKQTLQANWNQSNKEEVDYIKNKPFGEEILITPINEIYFEDGIDIDGIYQFNRSLGLVAGNSYTITAYAGNTIEDTVIVTALDSASLGADEVSAGTVVAVVLNSEGEIDTLVAVDYCLFNDSNLKYSESHCIIVNLGDSITKLVIEGLPEGTYDRYMINKLPNEYLELEIDQTFDPESTAPQSGIAIQQKLNQYTRNIDVTTTLDDGYIYVIPTRTIHGDIKTKDYNIYTQGLGKRENLKTKNKNTLVEAINELTYEDIKFTSNDIVLTTPQRHYLLKNTITSVPSLTYGQLFTNSDSYVYVVPIYKHGYPELKALAVDFTNKVIYSITITGITKSYDISEDFIDKINTWGEIKFVDVEHYYNSGWRIELKVITQLNGVYYLQTGLSYDNNIKPQIGITEITEIPSGVDFDNGYRHNFKVYDNYSSTWRHRATANALPSSSISPGKLYYLSVTSDNIQWVGDDSYSNLKVFTNDIQTTTYRALNSEGVEVINGNVTGYDNNIHSNYCKDSRTYSDVMCITSANEIISRNCSSGVINKVIKLKTDVNGRFGSSLPLLKLINVSNLLYVLFADRLYVIDLEEQEPEMIQVAEYSNSSLNNKNTTVFFANDYGTIFMSPQHTSYFYINILRELFDINDPVDDSIEYVFDGGNAPIE